MTGNSSVERKVVCKEEDVVSYLLKLSTEEVAFDTETTSLVYTELKLTGVSLCDGAYNIYIPIGLEGDDSIKIHAIGMYLKSVKKLIAHNWLFDAKVFYKYGIDLLSIKRFDTMIAHHLLDENSKHGLKYLTKTILEREVSDYDETLSHYDHKFYEYALDDSLNTWLLYKDLLPKIFNQKLEYLMFKVEMPFQNVLLEMLIEGVEIDTTLLDAQKSVLKQEIFTLNKLLLDELDERYSLQMSLGESEPVLVSNINFNSPKQLIEIFEKLNIPITEKTPTGNPSVGVKTISKNIQHPFVNILNKYKIASKLYNGFVSEDGQIYKNLEKDGKVRPSFRDTGTKTGRLSCNSPNLQQLPKPKEYAPVNVREVFKAPEGYKMFSCDYSGQEVAVMAQQSKDPTLVKSLNNGYDMHLAVANTFYNLGIPEEALSKKHTDYEEYKRKYNKERSQAKTITFGLAYGKGAYGFSKDFGVSEEEAQQMVDDYFAGMSKLKEAISKAHEEVEAKGTVTSMAGRKRHFDIEKDNPYALERAKRQSFNFLIQGFSADMIRGAAINVYKRNTNKEWGLKAVMTVHDEIVYICKEEYIDEATRMVKKAFEDVCKRFVVPVNADIEVGNNYGDAK